jgi:hypothetical protein
MRHGSIIKVFDGSLFKKSIKLSEIISWELFPITTILGEKFESELIVGSKKNPSVLEVYC